MERLAHLEFRLVVDHRPVPAGIPDVESMRGTIPDEVVDALGQTLAHPGVEELDT
ncbi:MAG: hypothetical protein QM589_12885 [Thermomicrobiales bacterium]